MKLTRKYIFSIMLTVFIVFTMLPEVAFAADPTDITDQFTDLKFRAEVRIALGKAAEAQIFDTDNFDSVTSLNLHAKEITSLAGIEYFTELITLSCNFNTLTELDVSTNTALTTLSCRNNQLTELDVSTNLALTNLYCDSNQLTELDVSTNTALTNLYCGNNQLTELDVSTNTALTSLLCDSNQLTELDVSTNTAITTLYCDSNQLTELDVSANLALTQLYCYSNQLTELDVSTNLALTQLSCRNNQLTELDVSTNTALTILSCRNNQLTELDVSTNTALIQLHCYNNQLTELNVSTNTALVHLYCQNNQLTELDLSTNSALVYMDCTGNYMPNESAVIGLDKSQTTNFSFNPQNSVTTTVDNTSQKSNQTVVSYVPTTSEEIMRYEYKGREQIEFSEISNLSKVPLTMNNSIQGRLFFNSIEMVFSEYEIGRTYNIFANGNKNTDVTDNPVTITLTIPEGLRKEGRTYKMIGVLKNGIPYVLEDIDEDEKTITFTTNHFYAFALAYSDK